MPPKRPRRLKRNVLACFAISLTVCGTFMLFGSSIYVSKRFSTADQYTPGADAASNSNLSEKQASAVQQPPLSRAAIKKTASEQQHRKVISDASRDVKNGTRQHRKSAKAHRPSALGTDAPEPPMQHFQPFTDHKYRIWKHPAVDRSPRCTAAKICDGVYECGSDGLGCIRDNYQRKMKVREATRWTWQGYR